MISCDATILPPKWCIWQDCGRNCGRFAPQCLSIHRTGKVSELAGCTTRNCLIKGQRTACCRTPHRLRQYGRGKTTSDAARRRPYHPRATLYQTVSKLTQRDFSARVGSRTPNNWLRKRSVRPRRPRKPTLTSIAMGGAQEPDCTASAHALRRRDISRYEPITKARWLVVNLSVAAL